MPNDELLTDDYVADLLTKDAKESSIKYSTLGLEAFSSHSKPPANKPKPNTRFLRNIIKDTDNHNAALLAKEAAESRARLQSLGGNTHREGKATRVGGGDIRRRQLGDIAAILGGRPSKRKRTEGSSRADNKVGRRANTSSEDEEPEKKIYEDRRSKNMSRGDDRDEFRGSTSLKANDKAGEYRERSNRHGSHRKKHRSSSEDRDGDDCKRKHRKISGDGGKDNKDERRRRHRSRSPREPSNKEFERRSRSPRRKQSPEKRQQSRKDEDPNPKSKVDYDSDPLDDIIGPRPPPVPEVRSRGRGTTSFGSGIDSRFSATYDPTVDVQLDLEEETDWDQALEALRDRQKWKQQGADRLRAAGFTNEEISKWEKGGEKREEDVTWAKKGEGREWDRGKIVDDDGIVTSGASWGRLNRASSEGDDIGTSESTWGRLKGT